VSVLSTVIDKLFEAGKGVPGLRRDQKRKRMLREMLEDDRYQWRSLATLARTIGASEEKTKELLISIGARASTGRGEELWGLRTRVGSG
jgi:hypothetical protein